MIVHDSMESTKQDVKLRCYEIPKVSTDQFNE